MLKSPIVLGALILLLACGGNKGAVSQSAQDESSAVETTDEKTSSEQNSPLTETKAAEETEDDSSGESEQTEEVEEIKETETVPEETPVAEQSAEPSSGDLQSYVGTKAYTPEYRTVRDNMNTIKQCYLDAMRADPDLQGTLKIRFTVTKAGKVKKASALENELNDRVAGCVISILKKLKFPKRVDNRTVEYPFKFIPGP